MWMVRFNLFLKIQVFYLAELPIWNFDGTSTGQATGDESDVFLKVTIPSNKLVLIENNSASRHV